MLRLQRVAAQLAPGVEGPDPATHRDPFALNPFGWWLGSPAALTPSQAGLELSAAQPAPTTPASGDGRRGRPQAAHVHGPALAQPTLRREHSYE